MPASGKKLRRAPRRWCWFAAMMILPSSSGAKQIYLQWSEELGGMDHEIIDAAVANSGEALKACWRGCAKRCRALPFFGGGRKRSGSRIAIFSATTARRARRR